MMEKHIKIWYSDSVKIVKYEGNKTNLTDPFNDVPYKPFLSRDSITKGAKTNNIEWVGYLEESYQESKKYEMGIKRLFKTDLPSDFRKWIEEYDTFIKLYNNYLDNQNPNYKIIDTYKCKAIWNLPQL